MDYENTLDSIIDTIKKLTPANMDFDKADAWVGCIIELNNIKTYLKHLECEASKVDADQGKGED